MIWLSDHHLCSSVDNPWHLVFIASNRTFASHSLLLSQLSLKSKCVTARFLTGNTKNINTTCVAQREIFLSNFFVPMSKNLNSCGKRQSVVKSRLKDLKSNFLFCSVLFCSQLNDLFYPEDRKGVTDKFPLKDDCSLFTTSYVKHSCNLPSLTSPLIAFSHIRMNILLSMFQSDDHLSSFFSVIKLRSAICDNIL